MEVTVFYMIMPNAIYICIYIYIYIYQFKGKISEIIAYPLCLVKRTKNILQLIKKNSIKW